MFIRAIIPVFNISDKSHPPGIVFGSGKGFTVAGDTQRKPAGLPLKSIRSNWNEVGLRSGRNPQEPGRQISENPIGSTSP
jgi:hypothetical protein